MTTPPTEATVATRSISRIMPANIVLQATNPVSSHPIPAGAFSAHKGAVAATEPRLARGFNLTNPSTNRPPPSGSRRINIGWKAQSLRFRRPKAQEVVAGLWTGDHRRPLVFVRLRATRGYRRNCDALPSKEVTTPAVLPAVPYRGVRRRQRRGAKPSAQRILTRKGGDRSVSRDRDCQHRSGRGPGARGRANPGEPPQAS